MKISRVLIVLASIVVVLGIASGWWGWAATERRSAIVASLPAQPDLSTAASELSDRVRRADALAHSILHARAGLVELSRLYHANGFLDEASRCYRELEQLEPKEPRWPHLHASILAGFGEIDAAQQLWQRVIQLAPGYVPAQLRLGDCYLKSNRPTEAAAAYAAVLQRDPTNAYGQLGLARLDLEAERWDQARERLEAVVRQTNYQLGYDLIVSLYERLGERDRANAIRATGKASGAFRDPPDAWLDDLASSCLDPFRLALTAGTVARDGNPAAAIALLQRAIELSPNDVSVHFQLGCLELQQHNFAVARNELERCTVLSPEFADACAWLATLQEQVGDNAAAERMLAEGLKNCPRSPGLHLMRARKLKSAGRLEEAANEYLVSGNLRPNEPDAFFELGSMYIDEGRVDEGVAQLRAALVAEPGNPMALGALAFHAITTGDEARAREWLARVHDQPRVPRDMVERLGAAYRDTFGHDYVPAN